MATVNAARILHSRLVEEKVPAVMHILPQTDHAFDLVLPRISPSAHNAMYDIERFLALQIKKVANTEGCESCNSSPELCNASCRQTRHFCTVVKILSHVMLFNVIMNNLKLSGILFFLAGSLTLMGIITAETFYPSGYSTFKSEISDLGATRQPNSVSFEPSASIFNSVMFFQWINDFNSHF